MVVVAIIVVASYVGFTGFKNSVFPSIVRFLMKLSIPRLITSDSGIANDDNDISTTSRLILIWRLYKYSVATLKIC